MNKSPIRQFMSLLLKVCISILSLKFNIIISYKAVRSYSRIQFYKASHLLKRFQKAATTMTSFANIPKANKNKYSDNSWITEAKSFTKLNLEYKQVTTTKKSIKCYCLSDIHADSEKNQIWVRQHCKRAKEDSEVFTVFILPGDIGSEIDRIGSVLSTLVANYDAVVYVPGNHEAWRRGTAAGGSALRPEERADNRMAADSEVKLAEILDYAKELGVFVGPLKVSSEAGRSVLVMPLYSWYHSGWDIEPDITHPEYLAVEEAIPFYRKWGDFSMCNWPSNIISDEKFIANLESSADLAESFALLNQPFLDMEIIKKTENNNDDNTTIISFSHFVPRIELSPEKRFLIEPKLSKVIGSDVLESQIRQLKPDLHLFGHTHIPIDLLLEKIRYIQWPLGYFREAQFQCAPIYNSGPLLVFDSNLTTRKCIPMDMPSLDTHWSRYYRLNARNPNNVNELAPWVLQRLATYSGLVYTNNKRQQQNASNVL